MTTFTLVQPSYLTISITGWKFITYNNSINQLYDVKNQLKLKNKILQLPLLRLKELSIRVKKVSIFY